MTIKQNFKILAVAVLLLAGCIEQEVTVQDDELIERITEQLPGGWTLSSRPGVIVLESTDSVTVVPGNGTNDSTAHESSERKEKRIRQLGKKITQQLLFAYEYRWSPEKIKATREANARYEQQLAALDKKYGTPGTGEGDTTATLTPEPASKQAEYAKEREAIEKQIKRLPDYHSEYFSLFLLSARGRSDDHHNVYPKETSEEMKKLEEHIARVLEK